MKTKCLVCNTTANLFQGSRICRKCAEKYMKKYLHPVSKSISIEDEQKVLSLYCEEIALDLSTSSIQYIFVYTQGTKDRVIVFHVNSSDESIISLPHESFSTYEDAFAFVKEHLKTWKYKIKNIPDLAECSVCHNPVSDFYYKTIGLCEECCKLYIEKYNLEPYYGTNKLNSSIVMFSAYAYDETDDIRNDHRYSIGVNIIKKPKSIQVCVYKSAYYDVIKPKKGQYTQWERKYDFYKVKKRNFKSYDKAFLFLSDLFKNWHDEIHKWCPQTKKAKPVLLTADKKLVSGVVQTLLTTRFFKELRQLSSTYAKKHFEKASTKNAHALVQSNLSILAALVDHIGYQIAQFEELLKELGYKTDEGSTIAEFKKNIEKMIQQAYREFKEMLQTNKDV